LLDPIDEVGWLAAWAAAPTATARDQIAAYAQRWRFVKPTLTGSDIRALSELKPGPVYGELLRHLRSAWLDGDVNTPEEERALLLALIRRET
jgi:tRNA nucleotidyltransferase (CCA-adding enzyme)